jgi:hypothetical protein
MKEAENTANPIQLESEAVQRKLSYMKWSNQSRKLLEKAERKWRSS